jgi:hypothetical protein
MKSLARFANLGTFTGVALAASMTGAALEGRAVAADGTSATTPLASTDFTLTLSRIDGAGVTTVLTTAELTTYFSAARCACPTSILAALTLADASSSKLDGHTLDAQIVVGNDCDDTAAAGCSSIGGTLTLTTGKLSASQTLTTSSIFAAASGTSTCGATTATSTRLWAIIRVDGTRLSTEPSLALTLGGAGPKAPTAVTVKSADQGLAVSWTASGDATTLSGHQLLCAPAGTTAFTAHYDLCPASAPDGGTGPFADLDPAFLCSDLVTVGTNTAHVNGLQNGTSYQVAVVAVGIDATPSVPSATATGTPGPTVGFEELYRQRGGTASEGCSIGGAGGRPSTGRPAGTALAAAAMVALASRRRRRRGSRVPAERCCPARLVHGLRLDVPRAGNGRRAPPPVTASLIAILASALACLWPAAAARAEGGISSALAATGGSAAPAASPRRWNLELRFGPYRPDIDSEFADRGSPARPFAETFSSSRRLMMQLEIDRQLTHAGGTWAVAAAVGYYHATAAALAADLTTRSGDETGLRLVPLAVSLVYRADLLRERLGSPLVPYAKAGLDCAFWQATRTSHANASGQTLGWHAAAGVTLDLAAFDADASETMDRESGVNQTALFFEVARTRLDGFGSSTALRLGDTTWLAGLMIEM